MSTTQVNFQDDDNLTTDSVPSPPRDDPEQKENISNRNSFSSSGKRPSYDNTKTQQIPQTYASVINISNSKMIHIGSNIVINCNKPKPPNKNYTLTSEIKRLFENDDSVRRPQLSFVSKYIGKNWRNVGRILGYSEGQMDQFEINQEVHGIEEVIYKLLLDWTQDKPDEATVGKLAKTLWEAEQQEAVQIWCDNFSDT